MAIGNLPREARDRAIDFVRSRFPGIYNTIDHHREFDDRLEHMLRETHLDIFRCCEIVAETMISRYPDLRRTHIANNYRHNWRDDRLDAIKYMNHATSVRMHQGDFPSNPGKPKKPLNAHAELVLIEEERKRTEEKMKREESYERLKDMMQSAQSRAITSQNIMNATELAIGCKPTQKKLSFMEQLQADVDAWLKDAKALLH